MAFTSDAKAKWAVLWMRWGGFNKFWSQLDALDAAQRDAQRHRGHGGAQRRDGRGPGRRDRIRKGEFINFLDSQVGVVSPDKQRTVVELEQVGPGRYRGRFPAAQEGVYLVGMAQRRAEQMVGSQLAGLVVPYSQEFRDLGVDESLLRELSELTGGGVLRAAAGRVPAGAAEVAADPRHLAVAGRAGRGDADSRDRAPSGRARPPRPARRTAAALSGSKEGPDM